MDNVNIANLSDSLHVEIFGDDYSKKCDVVIINALPSINGKNFKARTTYIKVHRFTHFYKL